MVDQGLADDFAGKLECASPHELLQTCLAAINGAATETKNSFDALSAGEEGGPIDDYEEGIRQLAVAHPLDWGTIVVADDHMRHERFPRLREDIEQQVASRTFTGYFDPQRPWEAVVAYAAYGSGHDDRWWFRQVEKPCMTGTPGEASNTAAAIEGSRGVLYLDEERERAGGHGVTNRSDAPASAPGPSRVQKRNLRRETAFAQGRRPDGRHLADSAGQELCFTWNRDPQGCSESCSGQPARSHRCEWCLSEGHRAVDDACPSPNRPRGWRPEPTGNGKGGGNGRSGPSFGGGRGQKRKQY